MEHLVISDHIKKEMPRYLVLQTWRELVHQGIQVLPIVKLVLSLANVGEDPLGALLIQLNFLHR